MTVIFRTKTAAVFINGGIHRVLYYEFDIIECQSLYGSAKFIWSNDSYLLKIMTAL